jgi:hypothetical protein
MACGTGAVEAKFNLDLRPLYHTFARLKNDIKSGAVRPGLCPESFPIYLTIPLWYHVRVVVVDFRRSADRISLYQKNHYST